MNVVSRFTLETVERAIDTGAAVALVAIGGASSNVIGWNWATIGGAFAAGAVVSVLTSLASQPIGDPLSPSMLKPQGTVPATAPVDNTPAIVPAEPVTATAPPVATPVNPEQGTVPAV
jgi:hypothetical protein